MANKKPTFDKSRPLSWSAISAFKWNKQQWYDKYVSGIMAEKSPELEFGSFVDKKYQDDKKFLPKFIRYPELQHVMKVKIGDIPLIGIADAYHPGIPAIRDLKTGRKPWDRKRANETGQLTMYALLLFLTNGTRPEGLELYIDWAPTHYVDTKLTFIEDHKILEPRTFKTSRTMQQVVAFGQEIHDVYTEMIAYCENKIIQAPHVKIKRPVSKFLK